MNLDVKLVEKMTFSQRESVVSLWQSAFEDDREFIERVLFSGDYKGAVLAVADDKVVGMAHLLSVKSHRQAVYCYAVATDEGYRGQGIATGILEFIKTYANDEGLAILLHPADGGLADYYAKRGFLPLSYRTKIRCQGDGGKYMLISPREYRSVREFAFDGIGAFLWSEELLSLSKLTFVGFDVNGEYCAAAVDGSFVYEICASPMAYGMAVRRAASLAGNATVYETVDIPLDAEIAVMGYNCGEFSYFNLFLE